MKVGEKRIKNNENQEKNKNEKMRTNKKSLEK